MRQLYLRIYLAVLASLVVFAVAAVKVSPDWAEVGKGFIPHIAQNNTTLYLYFVIGLLGADLPERQPRAVESGLLAQRRFEKVRLRHRALCKEPLDVVFERIERRLDGRRRGVPW